MTEAVVGRQPELTRIDAFLEGVPIGARVLLIEGEPGMGKTTLWNTGAEKAAGLGWRVLSARPSDAEATFAYAALGDLVEAAGEDALGSIPAPQQRALRVALLREESERPSPDAGAVAVAFLNVLRGLVRARPLLVAVDDVQWLDTPSALALGFALRRLRAEAIGILLARRVDRPGALPFGLDRPLAAASFERLPVGPLGVAATGELLRARRGLTLPRTMLERIHATSGGNPLFALELARALQTEPGRLRPGAELPLPDELAALLGEQFASLPAATQDALAIVAALARPSLELVAQATDGSIDETLQPALDAHVIALDEGRVRFTHPLRAAAARSRTSAARRREIHARLAGIVDTPEERARHLALAAIGPDDAVAQALEDAAREARARGAPGAASELFGLARGLTPADRLDDMRRRGLAEADSTRSAGDPLGARPLLEELLADSPPGPARAEVLSMLGANHFGNDVRASLALVSEALVEAGDDDRLRMRCEHWLAGGLDFLGEDVVEVGLHIRGMLDAAERLGDQAGLAMALGFVAQNDQRRTGHASAELVQRVMDLEPAVRDQISVAEWPTKGLAEILSWTDDSAAAIDRLEWFCRQSHERGDELSRLVYVSELVRVECVAGLWQRALAHADEGYDMALAASLGAFQAMILAGRALAEAHLGDESAARRDAEAALRLAAPLSALPADRTAAWALGLLELSLGDYARAHQQLGPLVDGRRTAGIGEPGDMRFVTDEAEALIGLGRFADAEALLDWYEGLARATGRLFALGACDRCRGLLALARGELEASIAALEASRACYATISDPFGLGRTLLALGTAQRRALHRHEARASLAASLEILDDLGARLWAERGRAELGRIGGRQAAGNTLTPAELEVARLVAEGRTNREVATTLVLSERTVESHLSTIYAKLQIRSRAELGRRLASGAEPA